MVDSGYRERLDSLSWSRGRRRQLVKMCQKKSRGVVDEDLPAVGEALGWLVAVKPTAPTVMVVDPQALVLALPHCLL